MFLESAILMAYMLIRKPATTQSTTVTVRSLPIAVSSYYYPKHQRYIHKQLIEDCDRLFKHEIKVTEKESKYFASEPRNDHYRFCNDTQVSICLTLQQQSICLTVIIITHYITCY